jgi:hypothetical protein
MQVGWIVKQDQGMLSRAVLWTGSEKGYVDLQAALPEPWTASSAHALHAEGTTLRVIGTATQVAMQNGHAVNAGELPVIWEIRLRSPARAFPRSRARRSRNRPNAGNHPPPVAASSSASRRVRPRSRRPSWTACSRLRTRALAPWVQHAMTAQQLSDLVRTSRFADVKPVDFQITGNDATLAALQGDATIDAAVTADNFRQWLWWTSSRAGRGPAARLLPAAGLVIEWRQDADRAPDGPVTGDLDFPAGCSSYLAAAKTADRCWCNPYTLIVAC